MPFVDTHVHLHFPEYAYDLDAVIDRAREGGVETFINVGTDLDSSLHSIALAEKYNFVYATAGIHPNDSKDVDAKAIQEIAHLVETSSKIVAIGEVGLDFYREHSPKEKQKEVLRAFIALYKKTQKPLIIHCRDAYEDLHALFKEESTKPWKGIMHCFSSDRKTMEKFLELGFYISFAGPLTYKKNDVLREACKACPLDRLLLETDAPFLPPQSIRGKRNESYYLLETAQVASELHGVSLEELGKRTTRNAFQVFSL
jgi:TatD DNase family protein